MFSQNLKRVVIKIPFMFIYIKKILLIGKFQLFLYINKSKWYHFTSEP